MKNMKHIPIIDELAAVILSRDRADKKIRLLKNKNIHLTVRIGNPCLIDNNVYIKEGSYIDAEIIGFTSISAIEKDIKEKEILVGVLAKHIRFNTSLIDNY